MTDMREQLKSHIKATLEGIRHLSVDDAAGMIAEIGDEIADAPAEDCINGAILDGIRWGYAAAAIVEMGGGAMLRIALPGGIGITHEWADETDAKRQLDAAPDALAMTRGAEQSS